MQDSTPFKARTRTVNVLLHSIIVLGAPRLWIPNCIKIFKRQSQLKVLRVRCWTGLLRPSATATKNTKLTSSTFPSHTGKVIFKYLLGSKVLLVRVLSTLLKSCWYFFYVFLRTYAKSRRYFVRSSQVLPKVSMSFFCVFKYIRIIFISFYKIPVVVPDSLVKHLFFLIKCRVYFLVSIAWLSIFSYLPIRLGITN